LLMGFIGLFVYTTFAALDQAFGVKDEKRKYFSRMARVIDALLNFVPVLITTVLLVVAGLFVSKSNPFRALSCVLQSSYLYAPIAAIAGGLGVTLGGTVRYTLDYAEERPWIGPKKATAKLQVSDLERAAMYQYIVYVLILALNLTWMAYIV
jgi:cobalamin biosynthesis protein CobD/CbiB